LPHNLPPTSPPRKVNQTRKPLPAAADVADVAAVAR
jgi:hypothetical protein